MPKLSTYLTDLQNLLGTNSSSTLYPTGTLITYINDGRRRVAVDSGCLRVLPPISGPITAITVTSGGTGYSTPTVIISTPDWPLGSGPSPNGAQATATANSGTNVTTITLASAGAGYFAPVITFSGIGTGATAIALVSGVVQTIAGQEVYPFSGLNPVVAQSGSGILGIQAIQSINMIWTTFRYTLQHQSFSKYQALTRNYGAGLYQYVPAVWAQYGFGEGGSFYVYPVPNTAYQLEIDCLCLPQDLTVDTDVDALPYPFYTAVKYYAAQLAYLQKQRWEDAKHMYNADPKAPGKYQEFLKSARQDAQPMSVSNWYGR